ncbi:hypothetical protein Q7P37_001881 [Cladosporium fusiforme]
MPVTPQKQSRPNAIVRTLRKIYNPLGFSKGYNATLWFILAGAMLGFCLARAPYLAFDTVFKREAAPGEWFYIRLPFYRAGFIIHLASVIPAGILAAVQFTPVLRYKALIVHRINGYVIFLLITLANVTGLMIARRTFGGTIETQTFVGVLAIATTTCMIISYINIKRLNIALHRAWMLRCWAYLGTPITTRLLMFLIAIIIGRVKSYYMAVPCAQIAYMGLTDGDKPDLNATSIYPACVADPNGWTAVNANLYSPQSVYEAMAGLQISFGTAGLLAMFIHAAAVELYLGLTVAETERLRKVSYERRAEKGMVDSEANADVESIRKDNAAGSTNFEDS